ncbi:hypothetical protein HYV85_02095 [Candidatus Woesearchaeota archaeon]|nr:hypothetical protein [Candidatus Woesearchaeota archaeon]
MEEFVNLPITKALQAIADSHNEKLVIAEGGDKGHTASLGIRRRLSDLGRLEFFVDTPTYLQGLEVKYEWGTVFKPNESYWSQASFDRLWKKRGVSSVMDNAIRLVSIPAEINTIMEAVESMFNMSWYESPPKEENPVIEKAFEAVYQAIVSTALSKV